MADRQAGIWLLEIYDTSSQSYPALRKYLFILFLSKVYTLPDTGPFIFIAVVMDALLLFSVCVCVCVCVCICMLVCLAI